MTAVLITKVVLIALLFGLSIRLPFIRITSLSRTLIVASVGAALLMMISRDARNRLLGWARSLSSVFGLITLFAVVMSFGPQIRAMDRVVLDTNLYAFFYSFVPGFDGLRVPARFGMIVMLGLAVLAAIGLQWLSTRLQSIRVRIAQLTRGGPSPSAERSLPSSRLQRRFPWTAMRSDTHGRASRHSRRCNAIHLRCTISSPRSRQQACSWSSRSASRRSTSATCTTPLAIGARSSTATQAERRRRTNSSTWRFRISSTRPERAWNVLAQHGPSHAIVHDAVLRGRPWQPREGVAAVKWGDRDRDVWIGSRLPVAGSLAPERPRRHEGTARFQVILDNNHPTMRADPLSYLATELDSLKQQGLYRHLRDPRRRTEGQHDASTTVRSSTSRRTTTSA